jgi:preprotein translocase subunit SecA
MYANNKKYIMAHIKVPMEINEDGTFETLPEYLSILFENLKELPDPSDNNYNNEYLKQQIISLLSNNNSSVTEEEPQPVEKPLLLSHIDLNNRKQKTHMKNITFKNKSRSVSRFTSKNYYSLISDEGSEGNHSPLNLNNKDVDLSE